MDSKEKVQLAKRIAAVVGSDNVTINETDVILNAHDAWPLSEAKIRAGEMLPLADLVVFPASSQETAEVLKIANELKVPVTPVGGGAGTCGGTLPIYGGIQLDLKRMDQVLEINHDSLLVTVEAGIVGIDLEEFLNRHGYTLGHTPTSMRASNIGGFIATRSGGSLSSLYGKIEDLTLGLECVLPNGSILSMKAIPRHSVGPDLRQLFIGSEGTLGVITQATLRIFPIPEERRFRSVAFPDVHSGLEAIRLIFRDGIQPSLVRLYDPEDTAMFVANHFDVEDGNCMMMLGFDGPPQKNAFDEAKSVELCMSLGGIDFGEGPAKRWWEHRYDMYYPTKLTTSGFAVGDTIDIVATYDKLESVYYAMKKAMEAHEALVMSHFSHMYQNGGSIYMIFFINSPDAETAWSTYKKIWDDGVAACLREGGTMSHQHGVGLTRTTYNEGEWGSAFEVLRQIKMVLDPNGIMNPGKMGLGVES
ncbi:MAG: FAD-binding oxidoreductase [Candidatus Thorarchaeota archaeon]|nr:FAD-binding oxidoreductase [Candidatus Thorarchaeota archaeon]